MQSRKDDQERLREDISRLQRRLLEKDQEIQSLRQRGTTGHSERIYVRQVIGEERWRAQVDCQRRQASRWIFCVKVPTEAAGIPLQTCLSEGGGLPSPRVLTACAIRGHPNGYSGRESIALGTGVVSANVVSNLPSSC